MTSIKDIHENEHLSPEELDRALVDLGDLPEQARAHLDSCPVCGREVARLLSGLENLGRLTRENAPRTVNTFRLPEPRPLLGRLLSRPLVAAGTGALALILVALVGLNLFTPGGGSRSGVASLEGALELSSVEAATTEADLLSPFQNFLIGLETVALEDDFLEFVVDPLESS